MDVIVAEAVNEVCSRASTGILLQHLWPRLQNSLMASGLHLCNSVKDAIWKSLRSIPSFHLQSEQSCRRSDDPSIQSFEEAERLGIKLVADDHLIDSSLGLYDLKYADAEISAPQRNALERLAVARTNGVTQNQLAKEFGIQGNNFFFIMKYLECQGLIMRKSTILRTKESQDDSADGTGNTLITTNLVYLTRYAKHLSPNTQQRFEIIRTNVGEKVNNIEERDFSGNALAVNLVEDDVLVYDYISSMRAVCDKLEAAYGKVLVVSDIKASLGYRKKEGHRSWRNICKRLKDAGYVEEFVAEVNKKVVKCLRLIKKFEPEFISDNFDSDQSTRCSKRGEITDQLVELPIDQQIYDIIEAKGCDGILITEVCRQLGLHQKRNHKRLVHLFSRLGVHQQPENFNRCLCYRLWTAGNFTGTGKFNEDSVSLCYKEGIDLPMAVALPAQEYVCHDELNSFDGCAMDGLCRALGSCNEHPVNDQTEEPQNLCLRLQKASKNVKKNIQSTHVNEAESCDLLLTTRSSLSQPAKSGGPKRYSGSTLTATSIHREQRILEKLESEKLVLMVELHRWLESFETEKSTTMAKKTLLSHLKKLQNEGHCKFFQVGAPAVSNCGRYRIIDVVLHSSIKSLSSEQVAQIHKKMRQFDMQIRGQRINQLNNSQLVPALEGVERNVDRSALKAQTEKLIAMRSNGFLLAKMVRAKCFHIFLWKHLNSLQNSEGVLSSELRGCNYHLSHSLLAMDKVVKAMPLMLFLQVVGSTHVPENFVDRRERDICLSDLPMQDFKWLVDTHAIGRLTVLINILCRLKLIKLCEKRPVNKRESIPYAVLAYAMELKPYIEVPLLKVPSSSSPSSDLSPRFRHDFVLLKRETVEVYWKMLEYHYAIADPVLASQAFPGSAVPEVCQHRSWASDHIITAEQRVELLKRLSGGDPDKSLSFKDCDAVAADLNLTLEQVLRVRHDKQLSHFPCSQTSFDHSRKRKRCVVTSAENMKTDAGSKNISDGTASAENVIGDNQEDSVECSSINRWAIMSVRQSRKRRFHWTYDSDRQLIMQYARYRACVGTKFNRVDWNSVPDLPACPGICRKRMAFLNTRSCVRRAVMNLCTLLCQRYIKHLNSCNGKEQDFQDAGSKEIIITSTNFSNVLGKTSQSCCQDVIWDNFCEPDVQKALDEVLRFINIAKMEKYRGVTLQQEKRCLVPPLATDIGTSTAQNAEEEACRLVSLSDQENGQPNRLLASSSVDTSKLRHWSVPEMSQRFPVHDNLELTRKARDLLAVANAVELLKVVLRSSVTLEVRQDLLETLRLYSEDDLASAFGFLCRKRFVVNGQGSRPFVLAKRFWHSALSSPFPVNTGKLASKFASWLQERFKDLLDDEVDLCDDLHCGGIFHLFALISSGEFHICPRLPKEGVGDIDEQKGVKRKMDEPELSCYDELKKQKSYNCDGECRREKGFPGIMVSVNCTALSSAKTMILYDDNGQCNLSSVLASVSEPSSENIIRKDKLAADNTRWTPHIVSDWEKISCYAVQTMQNNGSSGHGSAISPGLLMTMHNAICEAGQQGLKLEEISQMEAVQGCMETVEIVVDVLQCFGLAVKVNAYDCIHIVDSLYKPKYFLSPYQFLRPLSHLKSTGINVNGSCIPNKSNDHYVEQASNFCDGHKVTIINFQNDKQQCYQLPGHNGNSNGHVHEATPMSRKGLNMACTASDKFFASRPILPWMNGDGTVSTSVYKGLTRRVFGTVMQNPGIVEEDLIQHMDVLNPQSCKKLLELMVLDDHLTVREMQQMIFHGPPKLLGALFHPKLKGQELIYRKHYFANPMSTSLL